MRLIQQFFRHPLWLGGFLLNASKNWAGVRGHHGWMLVAMMIRISQGYTARNIVVTSSDKAAIWLVGLGGMVGLVLPQIWPQQYQNFVLFAAFSWKI